MKTLENPFKTTVRGLKSREGILRAVRQIQDKIFYYGVASDDEMEYLRTHTDWDRVNPRRQPTVN